MRASDIIARARARLLRRPLSGELVRTDDEAARALSGTLGTHDLLGRVNRAVLEVATRASAFHLPDLRTLYAQESGQPVPADCLRVLRSEVYRVPEVVVAESRPGAGDYAHETWVRCVERDATRAKIQRRSSPASASRPIFTLEDNVLRVEPEGKVRFYGVKAPVPITPAQLDGGDDILPLHDGFLSALVHHVVASVYEAEGDPRYGLCRGRFLALLTPYQPLSVAFPEDSVE